MTIQDYGSIGELVAAIATIATLFYLAMQIRHGTEATRAASQQALLDTFSEAGWELARNLELARIVGAGLVSFESLDDREKTAFSLILFRYVSNVEKGLRLRASGLIDQDTLDGVAGNLVAVMKAPGGAQWWKICAPFASPIVIEYVDQRLSDPQDASIPWDEQLPFWASWGSRSQASKKEGE